MVTNFIFGSVLRNKYYLLFTSCNNQSWSTEQDSTVWRSLQNNTMLYLYKFLTCSLSCLYYRNTYTPTVMCIFRLFYQAEDSNWKPVIHSACGGTSRTRSWWELSFNKNFFDTVDTIIKSGVELGQVVNRNTVGYHAAGQMNKCVLGKISDRRMEKHSPRRVILEEPTYNVGSNFPGMRYSFRISSQYFITGACPFPISLYEKIDQSIEQQGYRSI